MQADHNTRFVLHADQELAMLVREGDKDAFAVLCGRFSDMITKRATRYASTIGADVEDFVQEGLLALYRAAGNYSNSGQAAFRTYATTCVNHAMLAAIKKHLKHSKPLSPLSLEQLDDVIRSELPSAAPRPDKLFFDREVAQDYAELIKTRLSKFEQRVLQLYFRGHTYKQISELLNASTKSVDNALQRVRRKLRLNA